MTGKEMLKTYKVLFVLNVLATALHYYKGTGFVWLGCILIAICTVMVGILRKHQ